MITEMLVIIIVIIVIVIKTIVYAIMTVALKQHCLRVKLIVIIITKDINTTAYTATGVDGNDND